MRHHAAEHAAQDVPAALVRGLHAVGDQERRGAAVLGDRPSATRRRRVRPVARAREALRHLQQWAGTGRSRRRCRPPAGRSPRARATSPCRRSCRAAAPTTSPPSSTWSWMKTRFQISMNRSSSTSGPPSGPYVRPAVDEDLAARAGRTGGVGPPVVRQLALLVDLAAPHDAVRRDARQVDPGLDRLLVVLEHRDPQPVVVDAVPLGDELVRPGDRLGLEVVGEREVAEHLEERQVPSVAADVLDVVGAHHLLRR